MICSLLIIVWKVLILPYITNSTLMDKTVIAFMRISSSSCMRNHWACANLRHVLALTVGFWIVVKEFVVKKSIYVLCIFKEIICHLTIYSFLSVSTLSRLTVFWTCHRLIKRTMSLLISSPKSILSISTSNASFTRRVAIFRFQVTREPWIFYTSIVLTQTIGKWLWLGCMWRNSTCSFSYLVSNWS